MSRNPAPVPAPLPGVWTRLPALVLTSLLLLPLAVLPVGAQEAADGRIDPARIAVDVPQVETGAFNLIGNSLSIYVQTEVPGMVQIVRGRSGRVKVQARSDGGLPGFAMTDRGRNRLNLTGVGADRLTYVVVVPLRAMVTLYLPDRTLPESMSTGHASAVFQWEVPEELEPGSGVH
jgi:hypothetical protein